MTSDKCTLKILISLHKYIYIFNLLNIFIGMGLIDSDDSDGLSSDEEDQLLYTKSFDEDVATSGKAFARFKQQMLKEFYEDDDDDDDE